MRQSRQDSEINTVTRWVTKDDRSIDLIDDEQIDFHTAAVGTSSSSRSLSKSRQVSCRQAQLPIQSASTSSSASCPEPFQTPEATMESRRDRLRSMTATIITIPVPECVHRHPAPPAVTFDSHDQLEGEESTAAETAEESRLQSAIRIFLSAIVTSSASLSLL
jgi:hypothetical protein